MSFGSFLKKVVKVADPTGISSKLLSAGLGSKKGGGSAKPKKERYQRRKRNRYVAGSGYTPAAERYKKRTHKSTGDKK